MTTPPVLLIGYRRPSTTRKVVEALRIARPPVVCFSVNAPNPEAPNDGASCEQVRALVRELDWGCEVHTNFRGEHLSARQSIVSSIDWFFRQVDAGVILEDDCVPCEAFFKFCAEMLARFEDHPQVLHISGANHIGETGRDESYYFSNYPHIWGWATWRRGWEAFDQHANSLTRAQLEGLLAEKFTKPAERTYWPYIFDYVRSGRLDTWDYLWAFSIWVENGLCITPSANLVSNVGFGAEATNTTNRDSRFAAQATEELFFPLRHPDNVRADSDLDLRVSRELYGIESSYRLRHWKLRLSRRLPVPAKRWLKSRLGL